MFLLDLALIMHTEMVEREKHAKAQNSLDSIRKKNYCREIIKAVSGSITSFSVSIQNLSYCHV